MLGRVSSLDWLISISLLPVSFAITGPVAGLVGVRATLVGAGLIGGRGDARRAVPPGDAQRRGLDRAARPGNLRARLDQAQIRAEAEQDPVGVDGRAGRDEENHAVARRADLVVHLTPEIADAADDCSFRHRVP